VATDPTPSRPASGTPAQGAKPAPTSPGAGKPASGSASAAANRGGAPSSSKSGGASTSAPTKGGATTSAPVSPATSRPKSSPSPEPSTPPARPSQVRGDVGVSVDAAPRQQASDSRTGSGAAPASVAAAPAAAPRPAGPRRARLLVTRLDPWSVMKTSFMLSVSVGIVLLVATALLWWTLDVTQVFSTIGRTVNDIAGSGTTSFDFLSLVGFSRVMGVALVLVAIEIVLWSALATLFAFLYNLSVGLTGGLEVTLSEDA
jgi:hypothetical protein